MGQAAPRDPRAAWRSTRRRSSPRPARRERALSREAVVQAALRIVDAEGVDAVTMRRVADQLGTGAASLYAYVEDKDELLAAALDHVFGLADLAITPDPKRWKEQVKALVRSVRAALLAHRDLAKVALGTVPTGPNSLRGMEAFLSVLHAAKLPPKVIGYAGDLIAQFVTVSAYEASLFLAGAPTPEALAELHRQLLDYFESLPAAQFPTLRLLADDIIAPDEAEDARFEFGLDLLVRGLATHARSH